MASELATAVALSPAHVASSVRRHGMSLPERGLGGEIYSVMGNWSAG